MDGFTETTEAVELPEDAVEIDAKVYTVDDGSLLVVPSEPLTVEGLEEPLEQVEISLVDEIEAPDLGESDPAEMVTEPDETKVEEAAVKPKAEVVAEPEITLEEATAVLDAPETQTAFFKGGSKENPKWFMTANGDLFASIAYQSTPDADGKVREFFASESFPAKVVESARVIGWKTVLSNLKAELITKKAKLAVPEVIDRTATLSELRSQLKNDLSLAYSAMTARLRNNPFAAHLFEAVRASGMEAPEVFTAAVIEKSAQEFVTELSDVLDEVSGMSEPVKDEFKNLIARTTIPVQSTRQYVPDKNFMATLQEHSVPVTSVSQNPLAKTGRFNGIL
jgi:hypothetical protein